MFDLLKSNLKSIRILISFISLSFCVLGSSVYGAEDRSKDMKIVYKLLQEKKFDEGIQQLQALSENNNIKAQLLILGLAPAAHGGTRTGRAFTGDKSGDFLFKGLYSVKISNQNFSEKINDNLKLKSTYITNILKCVPPGDKPLNNELRKCSNYFIDELANLKNLKGQFFNWPFLYLMFFFDLFNP